MNTKTRKTIKKLVEGKHSREYITAAAWSTRDNNTSMIDIIDEIHAAELADLRAERDELRAKLDKMSDIAMRLLGKLPYGENPYAIGYVETCVNAAREVLAKYPKAD